MALSNTHGSSRAFMVGQMNVVASHGVVRERFPWMLPSQTEWVFTVTKSYLEQAAQNLQNLISQGVTDVGASAAIAFES